MDRQRQPGDEGEVSAQLQQELPQLPKYGRLQVLLAVGVLQPQEVQEVGVPEDQIRGHAVLLLEGLQLLPGHLDVELAPAIDPYGG